MCIYLQLCASLGHEICDVAIRMCYMSLIELDHLCCCMCMRTARLSHVPFNLKGGEDAMCMNYRHGLELDHLCCPVRLLLGNLLCTHFNHWG